MTSSRRPPAVLDVTAQWLHWASIMKTASMETAAVSPKMIFKSYRRIHECPRVRPALTHERESQRETHLHEADGVSTDNDLRNV